MNWPKLLISLVIPQLAGFIGAFTNTEASRAWYSTLVKPLYTPPSITFAIVWPILYLLMGVSLYLVWTQTGKMKRAALIAFGVQLALNTLWSLVFFGLKDTAGALVIIILLWLAIVVTIILYWRLSRTAALLMVPYLLWVTFAVYLNYAINLFA